MHLRTRYDPTKHHRRSIRLKGYAYASPGAYFVTLVTFDRECLFDNAILRHIAEYNWRAIIRHFENVVLDEWVVMPNHLHGIIIFRDDARRGEAFPENDFKATRLAFSQDGFDDDRERRNASPLPSSERQRPHGVEHGSLGAIIGNFKSITTRRINAIRHSHGASVWQRNYYEHIIRDEGDLDRLREYIVTNPTRWELDRENPRRLDKVDDWKDDEQHWFSKSKR